MPADVPPKKKGSPAKFSWQTILILRIAVLLRDRFNLGLEAHKASFASLKKVFQTKSFIALWGQRLALNSDGSWRLVEADVTYLEEDMLLIRLDPHLLVLRDGFALPDATGTSGQLDLFSLPNVHHSQSARMFRRTPVARRRSA